MITYYHLIMVSVIVFLAGFLAGRVFMTCFIKSEIRELYDLHNDSIRSLRKVVEDVNNKAENKKNPT